MKSIAHFIITRFNLRASAQDGGKQLDPGWLTQRLELFDRFCFPTVRGQTNQNFRWLVLFDEQTPLSIRERIAEYQRWPAFIPVFFPPGSERQAQEAVARHLDPALELLVTTRLDNDDGVCRTFVADIQRCTDVDVPTVLELPVGYVWHKDRVYLDRQRCNPFTTLVEPMREQRSYRTIYGGSHHEVAALGRIVVISERPSWVQVIHGDNRANHVRGVRRSIRELTPGFDIEHKLLTERESPLLLGLDRARTAVRAGTSRAWLAARSLAKHAASRRSPVAALSSSPRVSSCRATSGT